MTIETETKSLKQNPKPDASEEIKENSKNTDDVDVPDKKSKKGKKRKAETVNKNGLKTRENSTQNINGDLPDAEESVQQVSPNSGSKKMKTGNKNVKNYSKNFIEILK